MKSAEEVQATGVEEVSVSVVLMSSLNRIQRPLLSVDLTTNNVAGSASSLLLQCLNV